MGVTVAFADRIVATGVEKIFMVPPNLSVMSELGPVEAMGGTCPKKIG